MPLLMNSDMIILTDRMLKGILLFGWYPEYKADRDEYYERNNINEC